MDELSKIRAAIEPVLHWYQSDEAADRPLHEIISDIVEDLEEDRSDNLRMRRIAGEAVHGPDHRSTPALVRRFACRVLSENEDHLEGGVMSIKAERQALALLQRAGEALVPTEISWRIAEKFKRQGLVDLDPHFRRWLGRAVLTSGGRESLDREADRD